MMLDISFLPLLNGSQSILKNTEVRVLGQLESLDSNDNIWINADGKGYFIEMNNMKVLSIPDFDFTETSVESDEAPLKWEQPVQLNWKKMHTIPEGMKLLCSGTLENRHGRMEIHDGLVLFYEGDTSTLFRRLIRASRQRNEFWNEITPYSLVGGMFVNSILALFFFQMSFLKTAVFAVFAAVLPWIILLPPGILFFFWYRKAWARGRQMRCGRDLADLPLRFFKHSFGNIERYGCKYTYGFTADYSKVPAGCKLRASSLIPGAATKGFHYFYQQDGPDDPMLENVSFSSNPRELIGTLKKEARRFEFLGLLLFITGLSINALLFALILKLI